MAIPVLSAITEVAQALQEELHPAGSAALVENPLASPGDPWLQKAQSRIRCLGEDVLHLLLQGDDRERILTSLREAKGHPASVGAVARPVESQAVGIESLSHAWLKAFASAVQVVFVEAYDGESYIFWHR